MLVHTGTVLESKNVIKIVADGRHQLETIMIVTGCLTKRKQSTLGFFTLAQSGKSGQTSGGIMDDFSGKIVDFDQLRSRNKGRLPASTVDHAWAKMNACGFLTGSSVMATIGYNALVGTGRRGPSLT